jgi:hypothetical protein
MRTSKYRWRDKEFRLPATSALQCFRFLREAAVVGQMPTPDPTQGNIHSIASPHQLARRQWPAAIYEEGKLNMALEMAITWIRKWRPP